MSIVRFYWFCSNKVLFCRGRLPRSVLDRGWASGYLGNNAEPAISLIFYLPKADILHGDNIQGVILQIPDYLIPLPENTVVFAGQEL